MQHEVNAYTEDPQVKYLKNPRKFNLTGDKAPGIYAQLSIFLCW
jgi:hypothetical protein